MSNTTCRSSASTSTSGNTCCTTSGAASTSGSTTSGTASRSGSTSTTSGSPSTGAGTSTSTSTGTGASANFNRLGNERFAIRAEHWVASRVQDPSILAHGSSWWDSSVTARDERLAIWSDQRPAVGVKDLAVRTYRAARRDARIGIVESASHERFAVLPKHWLAVSIEDLPVGSDGPALWYARVRLIE